MVTTFDIETLGLDGYRDKIILIGLKRNNKIHQWKLWETKSEPEMIFKCLKVLQYVSSNEMIVGYNNLKFDVPFIIARLEVFEKMKPEIWDRLHNKKWFDLYQFLGNSYRSLTFWLNKLGIKRAFEEVRGSIVPKSYKIGNYKEIEEHNKDDLNTSEELFLKLKYQFPQLFKI